MPDEDDRATKAITFYLSILDTIKKVKEEVNWADDQETILALTDALASHLCITTKVMRYTKEEVKEALASVWEEQGEIEETISSIPDPARSLITPGEGDLN